MKFTIVMRLFLLSFLAALTVGSVTCQEEPFSTYNLSSIETSEAEICPSTQKLMEAIRKDVYSFLNNSTDSVEPVAVVIYDGELPISICLSFPVAPPHPNRLHTCTFYRLSIHAYAAYWYHKLVFAY